MKRFLPARATLALLAACGILSACGSKREESQATPTVVRVEVVTGNAGAPEGARYSAAIEPNVAVDVSFKVGGYVEEIAAVPGADGKPRLLQEGDHVAKGSVVARVRESESRDHMLEAKATLTRAKADYERATQLYENRTISKADYDAALAQMTGSQARFDQAQTTLADCTLRAPMDGVVLARPVEVGALVSPGSVALRIADTKSVKAVVGVPDRAVGALRTGQKQTVTAEAFPGERFEGTVSRVAPAADPTSRMFEIEIMIPNEDGRLKSGMIASVALAADSPADGALGAATSAPAPARTTVALGAIVRPPDDPEAFAVYVVEDSEGGATIARLRRVEVGSIQGSRVVVASGLAGGERVLVEGASQVADGLPVRIVP